MSAGLLKGLGAGLATAGDFMMRTKADELKEQRLRQYQLEAEARQNQRQDTIRAEDRANKLADDQAALDQTKGVMEDVKDDSGNLLGQRNTHTGEFKPFSQKSTTQRPISNGNAVYDPNTRTWSENPYASTEGKLSDAEKRAHDLFKTLAGKEARTDEEESLYQRLGAQLGYADAPQESGDTDAAFLAAFQKKANNAKLDAALVSTKDREPFNEFPGSLSDQVQKGPGLLQKAGDALSNFTKNQFAREVEGAKVFLDMVDRQISEGNANRSLVENLNSIYTNDALPPELRRKALELYKKANER